MLTNSTGLCIANCNKTANKDKLIIVSRKTLEAKYVCSLCDTCKKQSELLGLSIKLTTACTAEGLLALMLVAVSSLEHAELKLKTRLNLLSEKVCIQ